MFGNLTDTAVEKILKHFAGIAEWTMPTNLYVFLSSTNPGVTLTEPSGDGYQRVETDSEDWSYSNRKLSNASAITFPDATADWGTMYFAGVADASSGGNVLWWWRLGSVKTTLAEELTATDTSIDVDDASGLPLSGTIQIEDEDITYTGKSGNTLTGCTRGANGTTAKAHGSGHPVFLAEPREILSGDVFRFNTGAVELGIL